jgi:Zn-dependent peptidase ImmA (M78 family)/predicted secreted protein
MASRNHKRQSLEAISAASQLHARLGSARDKPVDVFEAIRSLGIWLVFQKLDNLLGATVRQGVGGIVITTERPLNLQRYTAAHELGHWILHDDEFTWDTDETVLQGDASAREHAAQIFAGAFLMPRQLVVGTLRRLGLQRGDRITPLMAYQASTIMGVSYEAALNQLQAMNLLTREEYSALKEVRPINIKTMLSGGIRPKNPQANVWLPAVEELQELNMAIGDEVVISVPENRTTGYRWTVPPKSQEANNEQGSAEIELVADDFELRTTQAAGSAAEPRAGGGGHRRMIFRANAAGHMVLPLALRRSFQADSPPADLITVSGKVQLDPARLQARVIAGISTEDQAAPRTGASDA